MERMLPTVKFFIGLPEKSQHLFFLFVTAKRVCDRSIVSLIKPNCIYNPITAMGFSTMFTFQLDNNTKR